MKKIGKFNMLKFLVVLYINLFTVFSLAETNVKASVDRDQLGIGEAFTLTLTVESDEDFEMPLPVLPRVAGLEEINSAVGGRQSSSSMTIINGKSQFKSQTSQDFQYLLSPQKEGIFLIPVIDLVVNKKTYKTQPIKIEVKEEFRNARKKQVEPKGRPRFPPGFGDDNEQEDSAGGQTAEDLFDQMLQQQRRLFGAGGGAFGGQNPADIPSRKLEINQKDPFFVYLEVDKREAYEGEQITANWYIYTKSNVISLDRVKFPDLKGFWKEIIEEVPALQFTEEIVNGEHYRKALLASHALFPIKAGTSVIDEFRIKAKIRNLTQFGWGKPYDITKASKRTEIKVLPLPQEGKTQSFSGAVGTYRISLKTEGTSFPANQPFSIRVRFEGIGNAKLIELPNINWPEGLEIYDTKSEAKFFREGNSYKEFEVLVIPRKEGELKIPSFDLTYFDPVQKKYVSQSTEELVLQIAAGVGGIAASPMTASGTVKNETSFEVQPILQLPEAGISVSAIRLPVYLTVFLLAFLGLLFNAVLQIKKFSKDSEVLTLIAIKLEKLSELQKQKDIRKIGSEATNLIYLLVASLAGQKKADQELHLLIKEISLKDQQMYLDRINILFDYFQLLGFSPDEVMQTTVNKKPLEEQIAQLKILAKEIVDKLKKEDKNNA